MKYFYFKNGNAAHSLETISSAETPITTGPKSFAYSLIADNPEDIFFLYSFSRINDQYRFDDNHAKSVRVRHHFFAVKMIMYILGFFVLLSDVKRYSPKVIICGSTGLPMWILSTYANIFNISFIHSRHNCINYAPTRLITKLINRIDLLFFKTFRRILCHGPCLKQELIDIGVNPSKLYEFEIPFQQANSGKDLSSVSTNAPYITCIGRLEEQKGIFDLIDAVKGVIDSGRFIHLHYVGVGTGVKKLEEKISAYGLDDFVFLKGFMDHSQLYSYIRQSQFIITPTRHSFPEGRCMVVLEALSQGKCVIAPDFGPFPYAVRDGVNGLLYTPDSVNDLKDKICKLIDEPQLLKQLNANAKATFNRLIDDKMTFAQAVAASLGTR